MNGKQISLWYAVNKQRPSKLVLVYELYVHNEKDNNRWIPGHKTRVEFLEFFFQKPTALD